MSPAPEDFQVESGSGRTRLSARVLFQGRSPVVVVSGGEAHIGAVALAEPVAREDTAEHAGARRATVSLLVRTGHREDELAAEAARRISTACGKPAVVCAGIHLDEITTEEIAQVRRNMEILTERILERLRQ
jgi:hypothetical protein